MKSQQHQCNSNKFDELAIKNHALAIKIYETAMKIIEIATTINEIDPHAPLLHPPVVPWDHATSQNPF